MTAPEIITLTIAVYGAILSTYNLFVSRKEKQWQLKVHVSEGVVTYSDNSMRPTVIVTARNVGHRSVTVASCGFSVQGEERMYVNMNPETQSAPLPHELAPGKSHLSWLTIEDAIRVLSESGHSDIVNLIGYCSDEIGNTYKSAPYPFKIKR